MDRFRLGAGSPLLIQGYVELFIACFRELQVENRVETNRHQNRTCVPKEHVATILASKIAASVYIWLSFLLASSIELHSTNT